MAEVGPPAFTPAIEAHANSGETPTAFDQSHLFFSAYVGTKDAPPPVRATEAAAEGETTRAQIERELTLFADSQGQQPPRLTNDQLIHDLNLPARSSEEDVLSRLRSSNRLVHCIDDTSCTLYTRQR